MGDLLSGLWQVATRQENSTTVPMNEFRGDSLGTNVRVKVYGGGGKSVNHGTDYEGRDYTPEQQLVRAVFEVSMADAMGKSRDAHKPCNGCFGARHTVRECGLKWLGSNDKSEGHSFLWMCDVLGLDAGYVRRGV